MLGEVHFRHHPIELLKMGDFFWARFHQFRITPPWRSWKSLDSGPQHFHHLIMVLLHTSELFRAQIQHIGLGAA